MHNEIISSKIFSEYGIIPLEWKYDDQLKIHYADTAFKRYIIWEEYSLFFYKINEITKSSPFIIGAKEEVSEQYYKEVELILDNCLQKKYFFKFEHSNPCGRIFLDGSRDD